jgi:hypothetical protein
MRVHCELFRFAKYAGIGVLICLFSSNWYWSNRQRSAMIDGLVLSGEVKASYAKNKAYAKFQENYRFRIEAADRISQDQRRFKEEHPEWPGKVQWETKDLPATLASSNAGGS